MSWWVEKSCLAASRRFAAATIAARYAFAPRAIVAPCKAPKRQGLGRNARSQRTPISPVCTIGRTAAVAPDLPAYRRWRSGRDLGDLPDRPTHRNAREISSRSSSLSAAKALRRGVGTIPPWNTTIRSTPVLFFLSSAREMAAALCPFFHRSHSSAFCRFREPNPRRHHGTPPHLVRLEGVALDRLNPPLNSGHSAALH